MPVLAAADAWQPPCKQGMKRMRDPHYLSIYARRGCILM